MTVLKRHCRSLLLIVGICSINAKPSKDLSLPVYDGRAILADSQKTAQQRRTIEPKVHELFDILKSGRSILINDSENWEESYGKESGLDIANVLKAAGKTGGFGGNSVNAWRTSLKTIGPSFAPLIKCWTTSAAPFQLLAVVNRMDLAEFRPKNSAGKWRGAELRFVYGNSCKLARPTDTVKLIVEFTFRPLSHIEFRDLGKFWYSRSDPKLSKIPRIGTALAPLLANPTLHFSSVRLRTNSNLNVHWNLFQWKTDAAMGWVRDTLDDDFPTPCLGEGVTTAHCAPLVTAWNSIEANQLRFYPLRPPLGPLGTYIPEVYSRSDSPMKLMAGKAELRPRNVLGIQRCRGCHTLEGGAEFEHIFNRAKEGKTARLSQFLIGLNTPDPGIDQLDLNNPNNKVHKATFEVRICNSASASCKVTVVRPFHDLARRKLFLAEVLYRLWDGLVNDYELQQVEEYGVNHSH